MHQKNKAFKRLLIITTCIEYNGAHRSKQQELNQEFKRKSKKVVISQRQLFVLYVTILIQQ